VCNKQGQLLIMAARIPQIQLFHPAWSHTSALALLPRRAPHGFRHSPLIHTRHLPMQTSWKAKADNDGDYRGGGCACAGAPPGSEPERACGVNSSLMRRARSAVASRPLAPRPAPSQGTRCAERGDDTGACCSRIGLYTRFYHPSTPYHTSAFRLPQVRKIAVY